MKIAKTILIGACVALALYIGAIVWTLNVYRFKITDPQDPKFRIEKFKIDDYMWSNKITFAQAQSAFMPGMKQSEVERILVKKNKSDFHDVTELLELKPLKDAIKCVRYDYVPWWNIPVSIAFGHLDGQRAFAIVCYDFSNQVVR